MKTFACRLALALLLASICTGALAQRRQQNQQQNQQNRMQQMASGLVQNAANAQAAQADPLLLIYRKDVQRDMGLDLGQRNKFDNLHDQQQRELQQARVQMRRNSTAVTDLQEKQKKETQTKMDELLTADQKARLNQIVLQLQGNVVLLKPEYQKLFQITPEQALRFQTIQTERDAKIASLQESVVQRQIMPQDINGQVLQIQSDMNASINAELIPEQQDQLKKLLGRPFKAG